MKTIILGFALLVCSHAFSQDFAPAPVALNFPEFKAIKEDSAGFDKTECEILEIGAMLGQDEFEYTLPHLYKPFYYHGAKWIQTGEANPVASFLFKNNQYATSYTLGLLAYSVPLFLLKDFDNQHLKNFPVKTEDLGMVIAVAIEMSAMHAWKCFDLGPQEQIWPIYAHAVSL